MTTPPDGAYSPDGAQPPVGGPGASATDDRGSAALIHLLGGIFGIVVAVIMWAVLKDRSAFVDAEGKKALNFQIWVAIGYVVSSFLMFAIVGFITYPLIWIASLVFGIKNYQAVSSGQESSYPALPVLVR